MEQPSPVSGKAEGFRASSLFSSADPLPVVRNVAPTAPSFRPHRGAHTAQSLRSCLNSVPGPPKAYFLCMSGEEPGHQVPG